MRTDRFGGELEHRAFEVRAKDRVLEGYAAHYNERTTIGHFTEEVAPGAFRDALKNDIVALFDHQPDRLLGRTRSGSLKLADDTKGLHFELELPDTQHGRDVAMLASRRDLGGASFGFTVTKEGQEWKDDHRILRSVNLKEISVVSAWPAYSKTADDLALRHAEYFGCSKQRRARIIALAEMKHWA